MGDKPEILVDNREKSNKAINALEEHFETKTWQLLVGDYLLCDREVCIERKTAPDFVASIGDRLMKQREKMVENFDHNYIIIVGDLLPWQETDMRDNSIMGMMASLQVKWGINILQVPTEEYFAYMCSRIHKKHGEILTFPKINIYQYQQALRLTNIK